MCAQRQREILHSAAQLVSPGGRLVYSTCTFSPEENEQTVCAFLEAHPEFSPEQVEAPWFASGPGGSFRIWPHKVLGEGHFAAVLRKSSGEESTVLPAKGAEAPKEWEEFARQMDITLPEGKAILFGQSLYWAPHELPDLTGVSVLRPGLELGALKKGRLEPAHALALWLGECAQEISFAWDSPQMNAYLHGEAIPGTLRGWCRVLVDGYGIGWAKGDGVWLKNHYPKGLRR